jgi:Tol biopolymer transport system component/DNA-binding CsgD family transcriptional regulator
MARRGRPRHPDILTPREWDVLALLREGATNEQVASRLGITERTAKFHVSEILGKLGVSSREEAAAWQPEERRSWWLAATAPFSFARRTAGGGLNAIGLAAGAGVLAAALAGIALLSIMLARGSDRGASPPQPLIAFSAGGSIYTVRPDGSELHEIIAGDRQSVWNAAPALSPDGSQLAYTQDYNIWIANSDGSGAHELAGVRDLQTPPDNSADNFSTGAQSIAWSPDGKRIANVMGRIGGSGVQELWVMNANGSGQTKLDSGGGVWEQPAWLDNDRVSIYVPGKVRVFNTATGAEEDAIPFAATGEFSFAAVPALPIDEDEWLVGPITSEGPITLGSANAGRKTVATGVAPALAPGGAAFAYFAGDTLRVAEIGGSADEQIVDLAPLGGRDRFFGEVGPCIPIGSAPGDVVPACSYRLPAISWVGPATEGTDARSIIYQPGIYMMRPNGTSLHRIADVGAFAWAPRGNGFAYAPSCGDRQQLVLTDGAESNRTATATLTHPVQSISWSPDGSTLAITEYNGTGAPRGLLEENDVQLLAVFDMVGEDPFSQSSFVGWSLDGKQYTIGTNAGPVIVDAASSARSPLPDSYARALWSPVDDRIAFTYMATPSVPPYSAWLASGVDVMNSDGTNRTTILPLERHGTTGASEPIAWSPDGKQLLVKPMTTNHFLVADATGAEPPLDLGQTFKLADGVWSPDGRLLALLQDNAPNTEVYIELVTPAGEQRKVISTGSLTTGPRFAPDSSRLTFVSGDVRSGSLSLYVTDVSVAGVPTPLAQADGKLPSLPDATNDGSLTLGELGWSADGQYIAFEASYPTDGDPCTRS